MKNLYMSIFTRIIYAIKTSLKKPYYGFIQGHGKLLSENFEKIDCLVGVDNIDVVKEFENSFARLVGDGEAIAYAAARMGFYDLLRQLKVGKGDEVILLGATCAVMANAVIRVGAKPIYSDIDINTFGSSVDAICPKISSRTRMIVAQHSFGVPCDILPIKNLAIQKNIFLLEDCALSFGSSIQGVTVGNFGDAALFSTDHSKPINTLTGGLIYTKNIILAENLRKAQEKAPSLSPLRQAALWQRLLLESRYCNPNSASKLPILDIYEYARKKLFTNAKDFLEDDFGVVAGKNYPYPAMLPAFLAKIGLLQLAEWNQIKMERVRLLKNIIILFKASKLANYLPKCYTYRHIEIVPLRFVWHQSQTNKILNALNKIVPVDRFWFRSPIIATKVPLEEYHYDVGSCPISEFVGSRIINIPCNIPSEFHDSFLHKFNKLIKDSV